MAVMPNEDIHPELRRAARFIPRFTVQPWALPLVRKLTDLRKPSNVGVEVLEKSFRTLKTPHLWLSPSLLHSVLSCLGWLPCRSARQAAD